jgi:hypothetical protein
MTQARAASSLCLSGRLIFAAIFVLLTALAV